VSAPDVSAILVNYNAGPELGRALRSIADELAGQRWEAVVIDNASSDGSGAIVAEWAPHARLVRNDMYRGRDAGRYHDALEWIFAAPDYVRNFRR